MSVTVNANSVKWEWTASSTSTYYLHDEVHSVKGSVASAGIGVKTSITETGLSANVLYARHVTTVTAGNETYSNIYSTYTRASTPGVPTLGVVSLSQLTVDINENGNSADTVYAIRINGGGYSNKFIQANGTVSGSAVYQTYASWGSNKLVTGLTANTQYTFAVIAKNVSEVVSAYSGSASIWTLANQAINPRHSTIGTASITWEWTSGGSQTDYAYGNTAAVSSGTTDTGTTWPQTGLPVNSLHILHVSARNGDGVKCSGTISTHAYTAANIPASPTLTNNLSNDMYVNINPNSNPSITEFAIKIDGGGYSDKYVQPDGSVGSSAVWRKDGEWGNQYVTGLSSNTQYTFSVKARNGDLAETTFASGNLYTLAGIPGPLSVGTVKNNSIAVSWTANGNPNPPGTTYIVETSGDGSSWSILTTTTSLNTVHSILDADKLYYYRVKARNGNSVESGYNASISTYTLSNIPSAPTLSNNGLTGINCDINVNSNPAWTTYAIKVSSGAADYFVQDNGTLGLSKIFFIDSYWGNKSVIGLSTNTMYNFSAIAKNQNNIETDASPVASLSTLADVPANLNFAVTYSSITLFWSGETNPYGTHYGISYSTFSNFSTIVTTLSYSGNLILQTKTFDFADLENTTFWFRLWAYNNNGVATAHISGSTKTLYGPVEVPINLTATSLIGSTSIQWRFNNNEHNINNLTSIVLATGPYTDVYSWMYQMSPSTGGARFDLWQGASALGGLIPNTSYTVTAGALNSVYSSWTAPVSTYTLAAVPSDLSFTGIAYSSVTLSWSNNTNPGYTRYGIAYSTFSSFTTIVTTVGFTAALTNNTTTFFDLYEHTTYYFRVWAYNNNGIATAHISGSTKTLYGPVEVPINLTATSLIGSTSIQWRFNNNEHNINNLTSIVLATGPYTDVYSWMYQMSPSTGGARFDLWQGASALGGLIPNTSYTVTAGALNSVYSSWTASVSTYTLAAVPQISSIGNIGTSSITVNWTGNGNPSYTQYEVDCSTVSPSFDPMVHKIYFNEGLTAAATTIFNLSPDTVYHFRIRARNQTGVVTVYSNIFSSQTLASVPDPLSFLDVAITSMSVHISSAGNPSNTSYAIKIAAAAGSGVKYVRRSDGVLITAPDYNLKSQWDGTYVIGLSTNVQYTFNVIAKNGQGIITDESIAVSTYTLASIPSGFDISGDLTHTGVTLSWNANTNPAGTKYGIIISSTSNFAEAEQQVVYSDGLTDTTKMFTHPFSNTTHYFSVWAYNEDRVATGKVNLAKMRRVLPPTDLAACSYVLYYSTVSGNDQYSKFIDISWKGSADKYTAEYYNIFRSTWPGGSYYYVDRVPANTNIDNYSYRDNSTVVNSERSIGTMATYYYVITTSDVYKFGSEISQEKKAEMDSAAPLLDVSAIYKINSLGGNVYIDVTANDYRDVSKTSAGKIDSITMFYRRYGVSVLGSWTSAAFDTSLNGGHSYSGTAAIPAGFIADCLKAGISAGHNYGELEYEIKVHDGGNSVSAVYIATVTFITEDQITRASGGTLTVPDGNSDDGDTSIVIPSLALTGDAVITIEQRGYPGDANPPPLAFENEQTDMIASGSTAPLVCFDFGPDNLKFDQPVLITLKYLDENNDGVVDTHTQVQEKDLRMFWWDGFGWKYISDYVDKDNPVDTAKKTLSAYVNHFTLFALFPAGVIPVKPTPVEKFITPATKDGCNDRIQFQCESAITKIEIYNITGKKVKSVENMDNWDGTDDDGNIVESGVYIYLVESANGKKRTGAVVVAK